MGSHFFILSGFILAYRYQDKLINKEVSWKSFYINRFARIYPLHIITFLIVLLINLVLNNYTPSFKLGLKAITNLLLFQSYIPKESVYFSINSPSWSISDEAFFYFLFPFLLFAIPFSKRKMLHLIPLISIIIILSLIKTIDATYHHAIFYIHPFIRVIDFILGIYIFNIWQLFPAKKYSKHFFTIIEVTSILVLSIFILLHKHVPEVYKYSSYYWLPMLIIVFSFAHQKGGISKILSSRATIFLGEISFAFYLTHYWIIKIVHKSSLFSIPTEIIVSLFLSLMISYLLYKYIEQPSNEKIKDIYSQYKKNNTKSVKNLNQ